MIQIILRKTLDLMVNWLQEICWEKNKVKCLYTNNIK